MCVPGLGQAIVAAFPEQVWCPLAPYLYFNDSFDNSNKALGRLANLRKKRPDLGWDGIYRDIVRRRKLRRSGKRSPAPETAALRPSSPPTSIQLLTHLSQVTLLASSPCQSCVSCVGLCD